MNEHFNEAMNRDPQFSAETEGKSAFYFFKTMAWLQERFPEAKYEDVTGLCKVSGVDEIEEQDWSLNPGRYVGVVIEEDGMTEEEFNDEMSKLNIALLELNNEGTSFLNLIENNYNSLFQE